MILYVNLCHDDEDTYGCHDSEGLIFGNATEYWEIFKQRGSSFCILLHDNMS